MGKKDATTARRRLTLGRKAALLVGLVIFIVGSGTASSYALWSTSATITGSATAGTVGISANGVASVALTGLTSTSTGPGSTATTSVAVKNTSSTLDLTYTTSMASTQSPTTGAFGNYITFTAWVTSAAANCTSGATVGSPSWTGTLNGTSTLGSNRALAAGATETYCVRTLMSSTAPQSVQGQGVSSVITFAGANASWTTSANGTFSQSSQTVPSATFDSCTTNLQANSAYLTWPAAAPTLNGSSFKQYFLEWYYGTPANPGALILSVTRTDPYAQPTSTGLTGNSFVRVTYQYQTGWNSLAPATYNFTRSNDNDRSPVCSPEK